VIEGIEGGQKDEKGDFMRKKKSRNKFYRFNRIKYILLYYDC